MLVLGRCFRTGKISAEGKKIRIPKSETNTLLNPKSEYRNPKQIQITKIRMSETISFENLNIRISILFRASNFVLRAFLGSAAFSDACRKQSGKLPDFGAEPKGK